MEASLNSPLGRIALGAGILKIGRASDNTLVINDPQSSSHHAEVAPGFDGQSYQVTDLSSTNGTFVNEQRLTPRTPYPLKAGDTIRVGSLRFTYEASLAAAPNSFHSDQTQASDPLGAQPTLYPQTPVLGSYNAPATPPTAPPAFIPPPPPPPQINQPRMDYPPAGGFGQPGYPPPGSFNQPVPRPKKSRAGLWIGLSLLFLLLLASAGIGGYIYANRSTPEKTLQAYCTALMNNDTQGIYNTLSSNLQANTDINKINTALKVVDFLAGGSITHCTYSNVEQNGNTANATVTLTPARGNSLGEPAQLIDENGQWKITTGSKLPGL